MSSSALFKSALGTSIADSIYNEIQAQTGKYYYFMGKTLSWSDPANPPVPIDSYDYELETRRRMITFKKINPTDVSFVIPRVSWVSGTIYDQYDDQYNDTVIGIDLQDGGYGYNREAIVTITGGGGYGATAIANTSEGVISSITLTSAGSGYTSAPTITITGDGSDAKAVAVMGTTYDGNFRLEDANMFVVTDDYNVYKCIDNNNQAESTVQPTGTSYNPLSFDDGYIWKYMLTIPVSQRNKFLTDEYIPVKNALNSSFYSNGEITNVTIESRGTGYTFANISVIGDGYIKSDPILLSGAIIESGGSGYTSAPIINIDPPVSGATPWAENVNVFLDRYVVAGNNYYRVTRSGTLGTTFPTHTNGIVSNGHTALEFVGTRATATANISDGSITSVSFNGSLYDISLTSAGSGYNSTPKVTIVGDGSGATAECVMCASSKSGESVAYVEVMSIGTGYTEAPDIIIGTQWEASTDYNIDEQIFYANRLYTVTQSGTSGEDAPTHNSGIETNGTLELEYVGYPATGNSQLKYGAGYSTVPRINIVNASGDSSGSGGRMYINSVKTEAKLIPIIKDGYIDKVIIKDGGTGYTYSTITVSGDGSNGQISTDFGLSDLDTVQANNELLTVDGQILNCPIVSGGFNYGFNPKVTIIGDGTGATAEAVSKDGKVVKINMTAYGSGYRWAKVFIETTGSAMGATARAIISPFGGHGKDVIHETFADTLMFYTSISSDTNQGFEINNDYRQIGILKNPRAFSKSFNTTNSTVENYTNTSGSACYVISGTINTDNFKTDDIIYLETPTGAKFQIVNVTNSSMLVQSIDNASPAVGNLIVSADNQYSFTVTGFSYPTIDKYSGSLLFIDNEQAFTPTSTQNVTIRTILGL